MGDVVLKWPIPSSWFMILNINGYLRKHTQKCSTCYRIINSREQSSRPHLENCIICLAMSWTCFTDGLLVSIPRVELLLVVKAEGDQNVSVLIQWNLQRHYVMNSNQILYVFESSEIRNHTNDNAKQTRFN